MDNTSDDDTVSPQGRRGESLLEAMAAADAANRVRPIPRPFFFPPHLQVRPEVTAAEVPAPAPVRIVQTKYMPSASLRDIAAERKTRTPLNSASSPPPLPGQRDPSGSIAPIDTERLDAKQDSVATKPGPSEFRPGGTVVDAAPGVPAPSISSPYPTRQAGELEPEFGADQSSHPAVDAHPKGPRGVPDLENAPDQPPGQSVATLPPADPSETQDVESYPIGYKWISAVEALPYGESPVRSEPTERSYDIAVRRLYFQAAEWGIAETFNAQVDPVDVACYLIEIRLEGSRSYWNLNRAALLYHLDRGRKIQALAETFEKAFQLLAGVRQIARSEEPPIRKPKKTIPQRDLLILVATLETMNRHVGWGNRSLCFLMAGLHSGARPEEWLDAEWAKDDPNAIVFVNAKRKTTIPVCRLVSAGQTIHQFEVATPESIPPGSKFDETQRTRDVQIDPEGRLWVAFHLSQLQEYLRQAPESDRAKQSKRYYHACRRCILATCKKAFGDAKKTGKGKTYSLYNARSQYASNIKFDHPRSEVQRRLGHLQGSDTTDKHYGPRSAAFGHSKTSPAEREQRNAQRRARAAESAERKNAPRDRAGGDDK